MHGARMSLTYAPLLSTAKEDISIHLKTACIYIIMKRLPATFAILVFSGVSAIRCDDVVRRD